MKRGSKRRSIIWKISREDMYKITSAHNSLADILRYFGLHAGAGNYKTLKNRLKEDDIDYSHIKLGLNSNKGRKSIIKKSVLEYLKPHSTMKSSRLKERLLDQNVLENKCSKCGQEPIWDSKPLVLQLDHINGDSSDNRIENLRILCPNCHTQTSTFAGRKMKQHHNCLSCHKSITRGSTYCIKCSNQNKSQHQQTKIIWSASEELIKSTNEFGFCEIGRRLGVSDNAIRKRIANHQ
jgi:Zn finger protein HypA/HybF involved in hydrogenase expression